MKKNKIIIWIIVVALALLVGFRIVSSKKKAKVVEADANKPVYTQKVARDTIQSVIKVYGNITASQQADIFSRVTGKLISNLVQEGDYVAVNQEIALIDRDEVGVSFTTATVKSTIDGVVLSRYLDPGAKVNPAAPIANVGNIKKVKVTVNLSENDFAKIRRGMKAQVFVDSYPGEKFSGEVSLVAPEIDMMTRTGKAEILLDNSEMKLKPGMFASVDIILSVHPGVIVIPRNAVIEEDSVKKVFVFENGTAKERILNVGLFDDNDIEVTGGLRVGQELIVEGHRRLKNKDAVRVVKE